MIANLRSRLRSPSSLMLLSAAVGLVVASCGACGSTSSSAGTTHSTVPTPIASPSPSTIASVNACDLVTASDASSALGKTMTSPASGATVQGACIYTSSDGLTAVYILAVAEPSAAAAQAISPSQFASAFTGAVTGSATPVSGIGDSAFEYVSTGGIIIFVVKSNVYFFILISPSPGPQVVESLAKTAVGRL